jgi:LmbE family N-acetylglucosaminyl deacetylase
MAHPDDLEYGGAAAVARWTRDGRRVAYLLLTKGEAGIDSMDPAEAAKVRVAEQQASAAVVGVHEVEFLDHPDGMLQYGLDLRRDLAAAIRRHRPEVVVAVNHRETYGGRYLNMADHRVAGQATIDAVRDAANRWVFTDLAASGLEPWGGVRHLAVLASPEPTHAVDVTDTFDLGVASLRAHAAYLAGLGDPDPEAFLRGAAEAASARFGGRLAVTFELLGA